MARVRRAIIFDIGRVLVRIDVARAMQGLSAGAHLFPKEVWKSIEHDPRWQDWQEGRITPRDWHLHISKRLGTKLTFEKFIDVWNLVLDPQPQLANSFLQKLASEYTLALLSNTDPIHVQHLEKSYGFYEYFSHRIYSCGVGASKPSPLIYREALRACKVSAARAVYIDDIPDYVEAARRLGMGGIVFRSAEQLSEDLNIWKSAET